MLQFVHVYAFSNIGFNGKNAKQFRRSCWIEDLKEDLISLSLTKLLFWFHDLGHVNSEGNKQIREKDVLVIVCENSKNFTGLRT